MEYQILWSFKSETRDLNTKVFHIRAKNIGDAVWKWIDDMKLKGVHEYCLDFVGLVQ